MEQKKIEIKEICKMKSESKLLTTENEEKSNGE